MLRFRELFPKRACSIIGMIHVGALPGTRYIFLFIYFLYKNKTWNVENIIKIYFLGTPKYNGNMKEIIKNALREAMIYKDCQVVNC